MVSVAQEEAPEKDGSLDKDRVFVPQAGAFEERLASVPQVEVLQVHYHGTLSATHRSGWTCCLLKAGSFAIRLLLVSLPAAIYGADLKSFLILQALPQAITAKHEEVQLIENYHLMGKGLGYVDMDLLSSVILTRVTFLILDKKLNRVAAKLRLAPEEKVGRDV